MKFPSSKIVQSVAKISLSVERISTNKLFAHATEKLRNVENRLAKRCDGLSGHFFVLINQINRK